MNDIQAERFLKELKDNAENASPEDKARGQDLAARFAFSRLGKAQKKRLQHA